MQPILEPIPRNPQGLALLRLGFRPFYLCSALLAAVAVPLWMAVFMGLLEWPAAVPPVWWHAHEMLFGFAGATIIGFLLTAGKAWTGLRTPRGTTLGALALLWLAARVAALVAPYAVYAALDTLLLPIVAAVMTRLLLRAGNTRNLPLAAILGLLALANLVFHLAVLQWLDLAPQQALHAALALIIMIECVMAGRVVPGFTMSATPGLMIAPLPWLERTSLGSTALGLALWVLAPPHLAPLAAGMLALAALAHLVRQWRWHPGVTRSKPILWILHASYAWIPAGLALLALAHAGVIGISAGIHALGVGATGGLIIGMMTRTARGHTGRTLQVGAWETFAYVLVMVAALLRVFPPLLSGDVLVPSLIIAAGAWSAAFTIYLWIYLPWLTQTRSDGRDG